MRDEYKHIPPTAAFEGLSPLAEGDVLAEGELLVSLHNQGSGLRKGDVAVVLEDYTIKNAYAAIEFYHLRLDFEGTWYPFRFARLGTTTKRDEAL